MLSAQDKRNKGILGVPDQLFGQYNKIRSRMEYSGMAVSYAVDAVDFIDSLTSIPTVLSKDEESIDFISSTGVVQTFEFKDFKFHVNHQTMVTLNTQENSELIICDEALRTYYSIEWSEGEIEDLSGHIGLNLYHNISINTHRMEPSPIQLAQLKTQILYGLCNIFDVSPSMLMNTLSMEFQDHIEKI